MRAARSSEDHLLLEGLRAGRREAFERLYESYHAAIYNLCARIVGDREEAKDLTQEVFLKAFSALPADTELALQPWLYRVATNACYNHLRSRKKLDDGDGAALDRAPAPVDGFEQAQTVALVEATLGQMNERYRTALVLKDLHGLPPEEIASVLDISRPTADVLVHRAHASFKQAFAKLAGDRIPAPASLGAVLVPLAVPAALHRLPPLPHLPAPAHLGPPLAGSGAGLLAKLTTAVGAKIAIGAAVASLVVGGGAFELASHAGHRHVARATPPAAFIAPSQATFVSRPGGRRHAPYDCALWSSQASWGAMSSWSWHMSSGDTWSGGRWQSAASESGSGSSWSGSSGSSGGRSWSGSGRDSGSGSWSSDSHRSGSGSSSSQRSSSGGSRSGSHSSSGGSWSNGSQRGGWSGGSSGGSGW